MAIEFNTYYTPEMEEFHIGFEYECLTPSKGYVKTIFGIDENPNPELDEFGNDDLMKAAHAIARVKYLDYDDLIEIGFKEINKKDPFTGQNYYELKREIGFNTGTMYRMIRYGDDKWYVEIETYGSYCTDLYRMQLYIKNKQELQKFLKQHSA